MNKLESNNITPGEFTCLLIGSMIGVGILSLPNDLVNVAKQDSWISAAIGAVYPLYMVIVASFLWKKHPQENILFLSKKYLGKYLGNILNLIFLLYFVLFTTSVAFGVSLILETLISNFLSTSKILLIIFFLAAYTSMKGLKLLGRLNQLMFLYTIFLSFILAVALLRGTYLNICPILGSGILNIIKASKNSAFAYGGIEVLFLIYPYVTDKKKITKSSLLSVIITALIYSWVTFITIYYLGIDIVPKIEWSVNSVTKTLEIPVINNFRFIFTILWATIIYKTISNHYFITAFILKDFFKKIPIKKIIYALYPLMLYLSLRYKNSADRLNFLNYIIPKYTLFNMIYVALITIIIYLKKDNLHEKQ